MSDKRVTFLHGFRDLSGREYSKAELKAFEGQTFFGCLGQDRNSVIALDKVSHRIKNLRVEYGCVSGELEILNTPCGKILRELKAVGTEMRPSLKATGFVKRYRVTDLKIIAIDMVMNA